MSRTNPVKVRISALGDSALIVGIVARTDTMPGEVVRLHRTLLSDRPGWIIDLVPAYESIGVFYDAEKLFAEHADSPHRMASEWVKRVAAKSVSSTSTSAPSRQIEIPVCYGGEFGPDLSNVAERARLEEEEVIHRHSTADYLVRAMGFAPGFPYLGGLPMELHTPRLETPRTRIPTGSVGIGGSQTGVYPFESPGGWNIVGRTPMKLFDADQNPPALLQIGDRVKFRVITARKFAELSKFESSRETKREAAEKPAIEVLSPGLQTLVQDRGRTGFQHQGVTPGGAMDPFALRIANMLVGNEPKAAALEAALVGPELRFLANAIVAVTGGEVEGCPGWRPLHIGAGEVLDLRHLTRGAIIYLAIGGGIDLPFKLNGRGTDLRGGFGGYHGRVLHKEDPLCVGDAPERIRPWLNRERAVALEDWFVGIHGRPGYSGSPTIRVMRGPQADWFSAASWKIFSGTPFEVLPQSDRMGIRLSGPKLARKSTREMSSEAVAFGSIQVPPSGQPIVLMADRQTIGGYPKIAQVAMVDLPLLAQLRPGDTVRFREIEIEETEALLLKQMREFEVLTESIANHFENPAH